MGHMKDFDRRIRQGGDDAIAAVSEYVASLRITAAERQAIEVACEDLRHQEEVATLRGMLQRMDCAQSPRWIPVSERLPEEEMVLVWSSSNGLHLARLDSRRQWMDADDNPGKKITHWMPLPEPPST